MGEERARSVLEGAFCVHSERLPMRNLRSHLALFSRDSVQPSVPRSSRPATAEANRKLKSWGSQMVLVDEFESYEHLSFVCGCRGRTACALLASTHDKQDVADEIDDIFTPWRD